MMPSSVLERGLIVGALIGAALTLGACDPNRGVSSVKTASVATQSLTRDIIFTPEGGLAAEDAASLQAFLASLNLGPADRLFIDDPHPEGAAARRAAVAAIVLRSGGVLAAALPPAAAHMPERTARLWIVRAHAQAPACPDWSSNPSANMTGAMHSNFGCAVNSNLAAMVADPNDLEEGHAYSGPGAADIAKAHDHWQRRVPTGFEKELTKTDTTSSE